MPTQLENNGRVERRRTQPATVTYVPCEPASRSLTAAPFASSFDCLREEIAQLRLLAASMHHLSRQVRGSIIACESGALPTDMLSGVALVKLEQDVVRLERQMDALVQSHYHRLRCVQRGRHWLSAHPLSEGSSK